MEWKSVVELVGEVGGSLVMKGFVREEKVLEDRDDVVTGLGEQVRSRALDGLEFISDFG